MEKFLNVIKFSTYIPYTAYEVRNTHEQYNKTMNKMEMNGETESEREKKRSRWLRKRNEHKISVKQKSELMMMTCCCYMVVWLAC